MKNTTYNLIYSIKLALFVIGMTIMVTQLSASELKPSQVKSLENQVKKIQKNEELLNQSVLLSDAQTIRKRTRDLDKTKKSLDRIAKALSRFPDNPAVSSAVKRLEKAKALLNTKRGALDKGRKSNEGTAQAQQGQLATLLSSQEIKDDIEMVNYLKSIMINSGLDMTDENTTKENLENWRGRLDSPGGNFGYFESDQEDIDELTVVLENSDKIIAASKDLIDQFNTLPMSGQTVAGHAFNNSIFKHFKMGLINAKKAIPLVIEKTAQGLRDAYKESLDGHNKAIARKDSSYLTTQYNPYGWYTSYKLRLRVFIQYHKAAKLDNLDKMLEIQKQALAYADEVSKEIRDYQIKYILPNQEPKWTAHMKEKLEKSKKQIEDLWQWGIKDREKLTKELMTYLEKRAIRKEIIQAKLNALPIKLKKRTKSW